MLKTILTRHPCFSEDASKKFGRIHLPVAPRCNISCNYCNRKYDCANESRSGVTSRVFTPEEAGESLSHARKAMPYISTVGIAGPGDSLANPSRTFKTLELARKESRSLHLCLSTNGLMLPDYVNELMELKVGYITVTINCVTPETGAKIYRWVRFRDKNYFGREGAEILLERQIEGLSLLKGKNIFIKVNTLYIPSINDFEVVRTAHAVKGMGAHMVNIMPLIPAKGSVFAELETPKDDEIKATQDAIGGDIEVMKHCRQCRSDAAGLLGNSEKPSCGAMRLKEGQG